MKLRASFLQKKAGGFGGPGGGYFSNSPIQRGKPAQQDNMSVDKYLLELQATPETAGVTLTPTGTQGTQGHQAPWQVYHDYPMSRKPWKTYDPAKDPSLMNNPNRRHVGLPLPSEKMTMVGSHKTASQHNWVIRDKKIVCEHCGAGWTSDIMGADCSAKTAGLWQDIVNPEGRDEMPVSMKTAPSGNRCTTCGGGLTRLGKRDGSTEMVCTTCRFGPKSAADINDPSIPDDMRPGGTGDYDFYKADPDSPAGKEEQGIMREMGIRGGLTASFLRSATNYNTEPQYGLRWCEFDKSSRKQTKEKWFSSAALREGYANKLEAKDNFSEFVAWSDPKEETPDVNVETLIAQRCEGQRIAHTEQDIAAAAAYVKGAQTSQDWDKLDPWVQGIIDRVTDVENDMRVVKTSSEMTECPKCGESLKKSELISHLNLHSPVPSHRKAPPSTGFTPEGRRPFRGSNMQPSVESLAQQHQNHDSMCDLSNPICRAYQDMRIADPGWHPGRTARFLTISEAKGYFYQAVAAGKYTVNKDGSIVNNADGRVFGDDTSQCCKGYHGRHRSTCPEYSKKFDETIEMLKGLKKEGKLAWQAPPPPKPPAHVQKAPHNIKRPAPPAGSPQVGYPGQNSFIGIEPTDSPVTDNTMTPEQHQQMDQQEKQRLEKLTPEQRKQEEQDILERMHQQDELVPQRQQNIASLTTSLQGDHSRLQLTANLLQKTGTNDDSQLLEAAGAFLQFLKNTPEGRRTETQGPEMEGTNPNWGPRDPQAYAGIRDWGNWETPPDAEGDTEDYDWQQLTEESSKKLDQYQKIFKAEAAKKYPGLKFDLSGSEKNWLSITVTREKAPKKNPAS